MAEEKKENEHPYKEEEAENQANPNFKLILVTDN